PAYRSPLSLPPQWISVSTLVRVLDLVKSFEVPDYLAKRYYQNSDELPEFGLVETPPFWTAAIFAIVFRP
ncbi:hypothetical protein AVEN_5671-1, partial [Araneus ventricosus]